MVGLFKSKLPFREPVSMQRDSWKRPLFAIAMVIVGCWEYSRLKGRRRLTGTQQRLEVVLRPSACVAREHRSVEDEDADFAAEIRAALREERLHSEYAACSGCEAVPNGLGLPGGADRGVNHTRLQDFPQHDDSERQNGSAPDEDAEFAAEIRAAHREEQLRGGTLSSSGREGGLGQVIHEGFGQFDGSHGGERVGRPPEISRPLWADQERLLLRRRGAGSGFQNHQEQSQGTEMDLHKKGIGSGVDNDAELAAPHAAALRARIDEICAGNVQSAR